MIYVTSYIWFLILYNFFYSFKNLHYNQDGMETLYQQLGVFAVQCNAILSHFSHHILRCGLAKTITAPHLIFAVTCAVWCGLEFSQNHNRTTPYFCGHMYNTMYKMWFKIDIFFKFLSPKLIFTFFGPNFKLLS